MAIQAILKQIPINFIQLNGGEISASTNTTTDEKISSFVIEYQSITSNTCTLTQDAQEQPRQPERGFDKDWDVTAEEDDFHTYYNIVVRNMTNRDIHVHIYYNVYYRTSGSLEGNYDFEINVSSNTEETIPFTKYTVDEIDEPIIQYDDCTAVWLS